MAVLVHIHLLCSVQEFLMVIEEGLVNLYFPSGIDVPILCKEERKAFYECKVFIVTPTKMWLAVVDGGILLSCEKEENCAICRDVHGPKDSHTE